MAAGTLYTYPENFRAAKALIAAQYAKTSVKLAPNFVFGETNKTKEFTDKFPSGKVPAFESNDGKCLQDSNAIAYFVADDQLRGKNEFDRAQILQWIGFAEGEVLPPVCAWVFPVIGILKNTGSNQEASQRAKEDMKAALTILNAHLLTRTYLVGERVTLADIVVACNLLNAYKYVLDPDYRKPFVNVNRWFNTLVNQREFKEVLGQVELCSKPAQIGAVKPAAQGKGKKEEKKQEKKSEKKQEKKQEAPEPEELEEEKPKKQEDPFAAMPKGTFDMDDFKRFYSNEEESKSIPYFWQKFDPENYSIWYCEYKYPEELAKVFMSCNLITGMFQRLDKMRKQAFASVCLFGEDNNSTISGVWVWRGQELAFPLSPDWQIDYESYDWKKLDASSEETKKLVEQYFSWTGTDKGGRKFNQGKVFK
ncbi:elongation factor 1-gamma [Leptinotarsa decemlineata]|uniref:elongation factor 1-gamma n=1 Tax=Leptinotarsa decemlineata TaxID=7539 RepID=UPI000C254013|nr:elongation factor 1-gamma [Leptinotarsa decemlineata]